MTQTITAYFDTRTEAQAAIDKLARIGISGSEVRIADSTTLTSRGTTANEDKGFFEAIGDFFMGDEEDDRHTYAEGVRRGGTVVTVSAPDGRFEEIADVLEGEGAADIDERAATWRSEGWEGTSASGSRAYSGGSIDPVGESTVANTGIGSSTGSSYAAASGAAGYSERDTLGTDLSKDRDGTIEVVQENLRVGKRDVSHGRVKVRSYVVEENVSEDVTLRSENVEISRRAVDRPVGAVDAFAERTIELEETAQEAVISKEARVVEEIDLKRDVRDRTETVSDTVRHTEVDISDERVGETLTDAERVRRGL
jgi:stress response protein YsnF